MSVEEGTKIKDLDAKTTVVTTDELAINDVADGNTDKKEGMDDIKTFMSSSPVFTGTAILPAVAAGAGAGKLELIEAYKAASAEGDHTFTFTANMETVYDHVFLTFSGFGLGGNLEAVINGAVDATYLQSGEKNNAGVETNINLTAQTQLLLNDSVGSGDSNYATLFITGSGADGRLLGRWSSGASLRKNQQGSWSFQTSQSNILTSIKIQLSAGNWNIDTKANVYGVKI